MNKADLERHAAGWVEAGLIEAAQRDAILAHETPTDERSQSSWVTTFGEGLAYLGGFALLGGICWWLSEWAIELTAFWQWAVLTAVTLALLGSGYRLLSLTEGVFQRLGGMLWNIALYTGGLALLRVSASIVGELDVRFQGEFFISEVTIFGSAGFLAGGLGLLLAAKGLRKDVSLARHIVTAMVLTSTMFIAAGSLMYEEELLPAFVSAPILWWHTRCHPHGAATGILTLVLTVYVPFALGMTTGEIDSEGAGFIWMGLIACVSWLIAVDRWQIGPKLAGWSLACGVLACWLLTYGAFYDGLGVVVGLFGAITLLTLSVRRQDTPLFGAGALCAIVMGPRAVFLVFGSTLSGALALIITGATLVGCGVGLVMLWTRVWGDTAD